MLTDDNIKKVITLVVCILYRNFDTIRNSVFIKALRKVNFHTYTNNFNPSNQPNKIISAPKILYIL